MKLKTYLTISLVAVVAAFSIGQTTFIRQNGSTNVYSSISDVFSNAQNGDTIYLPGGAFSIGTLTIDKEVHIYGVGHNPDSTLATFGTTLSGAINILNTGSNGSISGVYLSGLFRFGTSAANQGVNNYKIDRCNFGDLYLGYDYYQTSTATNITIRENILRGVIRGCNSQFVLFENNLIQGSLQFLNGNALVRNNNFIGGSGCPSYCLNDLTSVTLDNNIFMNNGACANVTITATNSSIFSKNVFNGNYSFPFGTNLGTGNYVNVSASGFFVSETNFQIEYTDDFHLTNPSTYLGIDGTQAGIYGGYAPFKAGSVPENPHISTKSIAPQTDSNGDLNINITVGAQED